LLASVAAATAAAAAEEEEEEEVEEGVWTLLQLLLLQLLLQVVGRMILRARLSGCCRVSIAARERLLTLLKLLLLLGVSKDKARFLPLLLMVLSRGKVEEEDDSRGEGTSKLLSSEVKEPASVMSSS
jgi:hypothetical protein